MKNWLWLHTPTRLQLVYSAIRGRPIIYGCRVNVAGAAVEISASVRPRCCQRR